jgi:hypothetical protein
VPPVEAGTENDVTLRCLVVVVFVAALLPPPVAAQGAAAAAPAAAQPPDDDPDRDPRPSQPDFTVITLPTTLRLPRHASAFRVTHRFSRPLGQGDVGDLAEDLFGLDSGGLIGLEYRFGLMRGLQAGIHRTSDRTISLFSRYNILNQADGRAFGLDVAVSVDGTNNFRDRYTPAVGVVLSRELGDRGAIYVEPMWLNNSNPAPRELVEDDDTVLVGLGARLRVRPTVYLVGEFIPRAGFTPGAHHGAFGIEKRAGGHSFQLNFSNGLGATPGQLALGGTASDDWYIGFNISRKFF